ncbi:hypothetical protein DPMN_000546 [Dreissena polymorpha]|uniref:Uncharacterized protein n=1 Tax=Dreissena polymorpha TaxID=45954 RepID=A0A9D4MFK0_DREPO|nr:hypothetical protein DPMN_000546 [Dreissena polymorpha]
MLLYGCETWTLPTKYRLYKSLIVSILLYGCETWTLPTKYKLYTSLIVSILLYGCETWTLHHQVQTLQVPDSLHPTVRLRDLDASPPSTYSKSP